MADIDYPAGLPKALSRAYSSQMTPAFIESNPAVGGFYTMKQTDDVWAEYNLQFTFTNGQAAYFWQWFKSELDWGTKPFNMEMKVHGEEIVQECKFTRAGIPQLVSEQGRIQTYSATVFTRSITTSFDGQYPMLKWFAERSPDGNPFTGMALLDHGITVNAPEA